MNVSISPSDRPANPSFIQRKYSPVTQSTTLIQSFHGCFFLNMISEKIGTNITYNAVMNPLFAAVVYAIPICCRPLARHRKIPPHTPAVISVFLLSFVCPFPRSIIRTAGSITMTDSQLLIARNDQPLKYLAPML